MLRVFLLFFFFPDPDKKINFVIFSLIVMKVQCYVSDEVDEFILRLLMLIKQTSKKNKIQNRHIPAVKYIEQYFNIKFVQFAAGGVKSSFPQRVVRKTIS